MWKEATVVIFQEGLSKTMKLSEDSLYVGLYGPRAPQNTEQDCWVLEQDVRFYSDYLQHKGEEVLGEVRRQYLQGDPWWNADLGTGLSRVSSGGVGWDDGFSTTAQN
jgi:hypothetical protein